MMCRACLLSLRCYSWHCWWTKFNTWVVVANKKTFLCTNGSS